LLDVVFFTFTLEMLLVIFSHLC